MTSNDALDDSDVVNTIHSARSLFLGEFFWHFSIFLAGQVWLVKVPKFVHEAWSKSEDGNVLGKF